MTETSALMRTSSFGTELDTTLTPPWGTFAIPAQAHHPLRALYTSASLPAHPEARTGQFSWGRAGPGSTPVPPTRSPERAPAAHTARASHRRCPWSCSSLPLTYCRGKENPARGDVRYLSGRPEAEKARWKEATGVRGAHLPVPPGLRGAHSRGARWVAGRLVSLGRRLLPDIGQGDEQRLGRRPSPGLLVGGRRARGAAGPARGAAPSGRGARAGGRQGAA